MQSLQKLQQTFEPKLYQLPPRIQGHYGLRMFRLSGKEEYLQSSLIDLYSVTDAQRFYACSSDDQAFIKHQANIMIDQLGNGPRARARKKAIQPWPEFIFYADALLRYGSRIDALGFYSPCHSKMLQALKDYDLTEAITDPAMIKSWAAQLANYVYWSEQLNSGDYIAAYTKAFKNVYADDKDSNLSKRQFKNKIYGMTHFIFAASHYYQKRISAKEFKWILDYFQNNIDRIINETSNDVIAEVGVSFLLAEQYQHPVVARCQDHIISQIDPHYNMILSPSGRFDLASGEHRNMLALMLLNGMQSPLHPGPNLASYSQLASYLPKGLQPLPK